MKLESCMIDLALQLALEPAKIKDSGSRLCERIAFQKHYWLRNCAASNVLLLEADFTTELGAAIFI